MIPTPPTTTETAAATMKTTISPDEIALGHLDDGGHALDLEDRALVVPLAEKRSIAATPSGIRSKSRTSAKSVSTRRVGVKNHATVIGTKIDSRRHLALPHRVDRLLEDAHDAERHPERPDRLAPAGSAPNSSS